MRIASFLGLSLLVALSGTGHAQTHIEIVTPMSPPTWALLERELLRANSRAVEEFYETYHDERGYLLHTPRWGTLDGTDDAGLGHLFRARNVWAETKGAIPVRA